MRILFVAALTAVVMLAQNPEQAAPQPVLIQGVVLDKVARTPIAGATVYLSTGTGPNLLNGTTDGAGQFQISVPSGVPFNLIASAPGHQGFQQRQPAAGQNAVFIEVTLDRLVEIRGRLIDGETKMPIAGVGIALVRGDLAVIESSPMAIPNGLATQGNGTFDFKNLSAGDYYLRIQSRPSPVFEEIPAKDLAPETRDKALEVPEPAEGYGILLWPGEDPAAPKAPPLKLISDLVDVGDIPLRRYKLHNLSGVLNSCAEGARLQVLLLGKNGAATVRLADLDTDCGNGFRILNLPEGSFTLIAQGGPPRMFVSEAIDARTRGPLFVNVSSAVSVQILIEVEGISKENFPQDLSRVNIGLTPENAPVKIDAPDTAAPDEYEAHLFGNERYRLSVVPPPNYYLKQLSYDGVTLPDLTGFMAVQGSRSTLRLLLSNRPGAVQVQAPPRSVVYLLKDGAKYADLILGIGMDPRMFQQVKADGKANFGGLRPGTYHAFAVDALLPYSQEGIDAGMLRSTTVTLEEGQTANITLALP